MSTPLIGAVIAVGRAEILGRRGAIRQHGPTWPPRASCDR
jgi:hypothetical protein